MITQRLRKELLTIRESASLKQASFSSLRDKYPISLRDRDEVDTFIKDHIRLYLETWIVARLDRILGEESATR